MAKAKEQTRISEIELQVGDKVQTFEISHAERLLRMTNNGGWEIPEGSIYKFNAKNGTIFRSDKGDSTESKEETNDKQSN